MRLFVLSSRQLIIVLVTLAFTLPLCMFFFSVEPQWVVEAWYAENLGGTHFQREMGFKTGPLSRVGNGTPLWGITSVAPGGVFAAAGVRVGDVPRQASFRSQVDGRWQLHPLWYNGRYGAVSFFYYFLEANRGMGPVTFTVCSRDTISPDRPCQEREVSVSVPER